MFVGSRCAKGKELDLPGRHDSDQVFIGIQVARVDSLRPHQLGRQARTHHRRRQHRDGLLPLGQTPRCRGVKVIARKTRKAQGVAVGNSKTLRKSRSRSSRTASRPVHHRERCADGDGVRTVLLAGGQRQTRTAGDGAARSSRVTRWCSPSVRTTPSRSSNATSASSSAKWDMPVVDQTTFMSTRPGVFFGGDAAFGPQNIIWAVGQGHQAAISIHNYCQGIPVTERPAHGMKLSSTRMGLHQWSYSNNFSAAARRRWCTSTAAALLEHDDGSGAGLHRRADGC